MNWQEQLEAFRRANPDLPEGDDIAADELRDIASRLKQKLGVGGSARGGDILIQGDCRSEVVELLKSMGYKARSI